MKPFEYTVFDLAGEVHRFDSGIPSASLPIGVYAYAHSNGHWYRKHSETRGNMWRYENIAQVPKEHRMMLLILT